MFREESDCDDRLVALARRGDVQAFERLHERYRPDLLAFCRHLTGQREDAEDAVQYTFFVTYRAIVETDRPLDARPWLFTVARNRCRSLLRGRRARRADGRLQGVEAPRELPAEQLEREATREGVSVAQYVRDAVLFRLAYSAGARDKAAEREAQSKPTR